MQKRPVCLIIRDGWGRGNPEPSNAIYSARTPHTSAYESGSPTVLVETSGLSVGLPRGYQGNSEVGHLNIGAGRTVYQSLTRIDKSVEDGDFFTNAAFLKAINFAKANGGNLHLIGLIQEEGVHAVTRHCAALLKLCRDQGLKNVLIHAITDGRDTPPKSALEHLALLQKGMDETGVGRIATVTGRYYAMDRDNRMDRTELAYRAIVEGKGAPVNSWREAIESSYAAGVNDEFIKPCILPVEEREKAIERSRASTSLSPQQLEKAIDSPEKAIGSPEKVIERSRNDLTPDYKGIADKDAVIFFNFRFDRTRQLTKAMAEPKFDAFSRQNGAPVKCFVAMTHYYDDGNFTEAYPEMRNANILGEVLSKRGLKQLRCAETEKFAHVTFFFNGQRNDPFDGEDRILIDSPKVATYDLKPEMSIFGVRDKLVEAINGGGYDAVICNFANCDMVGHTGVYDAIIKAVEAVDECVHDTVEAVVKLGGAAIITADHGNAEQTKLPDGSPMTSHTTNPVPLTIIGAGDIKLRDGGTLADIAPTFLQLMGQEQPAEMTGKTLIRED
ncbi:MAG: 2,3-bisphosphoglycerate-independent phosphoglycerate mutase [Chitinispirillales bacterium]|jgi:2,3-bisphosphoglycerate-independent phosphoglycerate mutase|nr:2,3-bisphosphoglycerate-independent phosphoglycerate mutase [Chitinispirillales bacterium]